MGIHDMEKKVQSFHQVLFYAKYLKGPKEMEESFYGKATNDGLNPDFKQFLDYARKQALV
jgi:hypothetical protein